MSHPKISKNLSIFVVLIATIFVVGGLSATSAQSRPAASTQADLFTKCWEYKSSPDLADGFTANDSSLYFLNTDSTLEAVDISLATKRWSTELGGEIISNLLVGDSAVWVATVTPASGDAAPRKVFLRALSQQTGITNWSKEITASSRIFLGALSGHVIAVGSEGSIAGYSAGDGTQLWTRQLDSGVTTDPYFGSSELLLGTGKKEILGVTGADGQTRLLSKLAHVPSAVFDAPGDRHLVGDERGNLILASSSGKRWTFKNGAKISFVMSYDSEYLASSFDNFIYKLSRGGNVEWKRRLSGRVANRPLVINDAAIVSTVGDGSVYILDLKNGKVLNRIETGDESTAGVARTGSSGGFVLSTTKGFSFYSHEKCPSK